MKKFVSLCLALVMCLALAVPAAAYTDTDPPLWQRLGFGSLDECMKAYWYNGFTVEEYGVLAERSAGFDPDAFYDKMYRAAYGPAEDFMAIYSYSRGEFEENMLILWFSGEVLDFWEARSAEEYQHQQEEARNRAIQEAGGTPGQVNVMINGQCVAFQGAWPEIVNNRTMVPLRGVLEALGAKVDYEDAARTATVTLGETVLTHVIGTDMLTVGGGETLTMDVASCVKNNQTLVPVRFFSQALGYEVYWDKEFRTVVLVDRAAMVEKIDGQFTILNGFQEKQAAALDTTKNLQTDVSLAGDILIYDTISGSSKHKFSASASILQGQEGMEVSMKMDLTLLADLLRAMDEEIPAGMAGILKNVTLEAIYRGSSTWYSSSLLDQMYEESGGRVPAGGLWFKEDGGAYFSPFLAQNTGLTLGQALYAAAEESENPFFLYKELGEIAGVAALFLGDQTFTKSGGDYKWRLSQKEIDALGEELDDLFLTDDIDFPITIEMTLKADGGMDFSLTGVYEEGGVTAGKFSMIASGTPQRVDMTISLQLRNICDVTLKGGVTAKVTDKNPRTEPPKDALVVDEDYGRMPLRA